MHLTDPAPPTAPAPGIHRVAPAAQALRVSPFDLFWTFTRISLSGFGSVMPSARQTLVHQRGWVDDRAFAELLAIGQILPGPNICNIAVIIGYRYGGLAGAVAALAGLIGAPFVIVLLLGALYHRFGELAAVRGALNAMSAVAAGLVIATGIKLAQGQPRRVRGLVFGLLAFLAVSVLHWPLGWTMLVLVPSALFVEWRAKQ